jgi:hypothetical protein
MIFPILCKVLFALFSIFIAISDVYKGVVPRIAFMVGFPVFLAVIILQEGYSLLWVNFAGAFIGLFIFAIAYFVSGKKLGKADIWYSGIIGLVLGPVWWYPAIGIACIAGVTWIIVSKKRQIPFIPCMAAGGISMSFVQGLIK